MQIFVKSDGHVMSCIRSEASREDLMLVLNVVLSDKVKTARSSRFSFGNLLGPHFVDMMGTITFI